MTARKLDTMRNMVVMQDEGIVYCPIPKVCFVQGNSFCAYAARGGSVEGEKDARDTVVVDVLVAITNELHRQCEP